MTALLKPVRRQSEATIRDGGKRRRLVVVLYPNDTIGLRPAQTRREELIPLEAVYALAVRLRVAQERRDKAAAKKARRNAHA